MLSSFGLTPGEIARIIVFNVVTFWLGFAAIGGAALAFEPLDAADRLAGTLLASRSGSRCSALSRRIWS